jgi:MFS family permease
MVLFARVLDRFGKGVRSTARDAIIAESSKPELRGRAFGFHRSLDQVGAVVGPLIAVPLLAVFAQNYRTLFVVAFIPAAVSTLMLFLVRETGRAVTGKVAPPSLRWRDTTPAFRRFLLVTLLFALGNSSDVFLILRARQLGISAQQIFAIYAVFNLTTVLSAYPAGYFSDHLGRKRVLTVSFFIFALAYGGFAFATHRAHIWMLFILYGLYMGMSDGVSRAFAVDLVSPDHRGTALGLHSLASGITTFAASSIAGAMWSPLGSSAVFIYGAGMALVAMVLLQVLVHPQKEVQPEEARLL